MTLGEISQYLTRIGLAARKRDYAEARRLEQWLFIETLMAVAEGVAGAEHAKLALRSRELDLRRDTF